MKVNGRNLTAEEINKEMIQYGHVRTEAELILEKSRLELRRVREMLRRNEDGKLLLSVLEDMYYDGNLVGDDPHETYRKLGQRDVVKFLRDLRDEKEQ
jgi:hypothetical protein